MSVIEVQSAFESAAILARCARAHGVSVAKVQAKFLQVFVSERAAVLAAELVVDERKLVRVLDRVEKRERSRLISQSWADQRWRPIV